MLVAGHSPSQTHRKLREWGFQAAETGFALRIKIVSLLVFPALSLPFFQQLRQQPVPCTMLQPQVCHTGVQLSVCTSASPSGM